MDDMDVALTKVEPYCAAIVGARLRDLVERDIRRREHVAPAGVDRDGLDPISR